MLKYFRILILLHLATITIFAQGLPSSAGEWFTLLLNANPNSLNPLERELAGHVVAWKDRLAPISQWQDQHQQLVALAGALKTQDVAMIEYLLLQEVFNQLGLGDAYEPMMWLVDASKKSQSNSKDSKNPFNALAIPALPKLPAIPQIKTNNSFIDGTLGVLNKVQGIQQMSHLERALRLVAALSKLSVSQQQAILSVFFGQDKTKALLPVVKVGGTLVSTYDQLKGLESMQQELMQLVTISNLDSFYQAAGYQQLLVSAFGSNMVSSMQLPAGDSPQGLLLAIGASVLVHKSDTQKHLSTLNSVYMHPQVVPLLMEIVTELRKVMRL